MIKIIGFNEKNVTSEILDTLKKSDLVVIKTKFFSGFKYIEELGVNFVTLDNEFEKANDFDELNNNLANAVLEFSKENKNICYVLPMYAITDASVKILKNNGKNVQIVATESVFNDIAKESVVDTSYAVYSAYDLLNSKSVSLNTNIINVIYDIDDNFLCSELKLKLFNFYGEESDVFVKENGKVKKIKLFELDQDEIKEPISILLNKQDILNKERYNFSDLIEIMYRLRGENGCPWDREQNHESIKMNLVEEAYELVEAIELDDIAKMREETGDVLLQAVFHSVIGEDMQEFNAYDCISELCQKLIFRHSHIFGVDKAENSEMAINTWESNKVKEKGFSGVNDEILSIPKQFPALLRMNKVFKKLIKNGISLPSEEDVKKVIREELDKKELGEKEIGLILACVCLISNLKQVDAEKSLMEKTEYNF